MKFYTFGKEDAPAILLLPGTCCHWKRNFGNVIPLLEKDFRVVCVSYDGFDETEETVFPDMLTPPDFIIEGFYRGKKDGAREWPSGGSSVSLQGKPLPYLPYAYRHPEYWKRIMADSKAGGDRIASRPMFDESERRHPVQKAEKIRVENIRGKVVFVGAEDDVLWDTCKYIHRMEKRLNVLPHGCEVETLIYEHGTHFVFPQSMLEAMIPIGSGLLIRFMFKAGREYPKACRQTRVDIDEKLSKNILEW